MTEALEILERVQIKPSYQRLSVLEALLANRTHPTADSVYRDLADRVPVISRATVYNTLALFLEKGIVSTMISGRNELRYDLVTQPHGHFICRCCERIFNFPYEYENRYAGLEDFLIEREEIVLRGVCGECKRTPCGRNGLSEA